MALHTIILRIEMEVESDLSLEEVLENLENEMDLDFTNQEITDAVINNSSVLDLE
jgi:uncharacterized protein YihD (DUF1040 family)